MVSDCTTVTSVTGEGKDGETTALSIFDQLEKERTALTELKKPDVFINHLGSTYGIDIARKYHAIFNVIRSTGEHDTFQPTMVRIVTGQEREKEVVNKFKRGDIYFAKLNEQVPADMLFFPLYAHRENHWYGEENPLICYSCDGESGERFAGQDAGQKIKCGTKACPNVPDLYQPSTDACKATTALYLVDSSFTRIYKMGIRFQGHKMVLKDFIENTKKRGVRFDPIESAWFTLASEEVPSKKDPKKKAWYFKARVTDKKVEAGDGEIVQQLTALMSHYQHGLQDRRDRKQEVAAQSLKDLEAQSFDVAQTIDSDGTPIVDFS